MKLAFSTLGCPEKSLEEILALAERFQLDGVEIRGIQRDLDIDKIPDIFPEKRPLLQRELRRRNLVVCSLDCSASFASAAGGERARAEVAYAMRAAADIGVPAVRVFGGKNDDPLACKQVAEQINLLCRREPTVSVLLETHDSFCETKTLKQVTERISQPNFGILWDVEHTRRVGIAPDEFIRCFGLQIRQVHLKDYNRDRLCLPGEGVIDIRGVCNLLLDNGFDGFFSLEWEKRWEKSLPELEVALERFVSILRD